MALTTFAFLHPLTPEQRRRFDGALPGVELLVPERPGLPAGIERAQARGDSWTGPPSTTCWSRRTTCNGCISAAPASTASSHRQASSRARWC